MFKQTLTLLGLSFLLAGYSHSETIRYSYTGNLTHAEGSFWNYWGYSVVGEFSYDTDSFVDPHYIDQHQEKVRYDNLQNNADNYFRYSILDENDNIVYSDSYALVTSTIWDNAIDRTSAPNGRSTDIFYAYGVEGADENGYGGYATGFSFSIYNSVNPQLVDSLLPPTTIDLGLAGLGNGGSFYETNENGYSIGHAQYTINSLTPVSSIPVPAAAWLFSSALIGLAGTKRSRS